MSTCRWSFRQRMPWQVVSTPEQRSEQRVKAELCAFPVQGVLGSLQYLINRVACADGRDHREDHQAIPNWVREAMHKGKRSLHSDRTQPGKTGESISAGAVRQGIHEGTGEEETRSFRWASNYTTIDS